MSGIILNPPSGAKTWPIHDLLMVAPRMGKVRVRKLLHRLMIPEHKEVGELTEHQRRVIIGALEGRRP